MQQARGKLLLVAGLLVLVIFFLTVSPAFAEPINSFPDYGDNSSGVSLGGIMTNLIALPINGLAYGLVNLPSFYSIDQLVFGQEGAFTKDEWENVVKPWWKWAFGLGTMAQLIGFVVLAGGFSIVRGVFLKDPRTAASAQETFLNLVVATLFTATGPLILDFFLKINGVIVELVKNYLLNNGVGVSGLAKAELLKSVNSGGPLLDALIRLAFAGLMFHLNMMYLVRRFVLAVLLIVMPFVAWSWAFKNTRTPMFILLSELATNSLMSATHALVLGFYLSLVSKNPAGMFGTWWAKLFAMIMIIPSAALLRRMIAGWLNFLGINEEHWAGLATMGFGGLAGLATLAGGVAGGVANVAHTAITAGSRGSGGPRDSGGGGSGGPLPVGTVMGTVPGGFGVTLSRPVQVPPGTVGGTPGFAGPAGANGVPGPQGRPGVMGPAGIGVSGAPGAPGAPGAYGAAWTVSPPVGYKEDARTGIFIPGDLAVKREDEALAQAAAAQTASMEAKQPGWKEKMAPVLDAATEAAGAFGRFAGGVMSIGIGGGAAGSAYSRLMEGAMRAPLAVTRRVMMPQSRPYSLDRPRWH